MALFNRSAKRWIRTPQYILMRKYLGILLLLALTANSSSWAGAPPSGIQAQVKKLGGQKVKVTLADGTLEKGKVGTVDDQSFVLDRGSKKGISTISYTSVNAIQRDGLSTGSKIVIAGGVAAVTIGVVAVVVAQHTSGGNLCPPDNPYCL